MLAELEALVAVVEVGSMERAASSLYLTPSALTRRIQRLEAELGLVLFDRSFKPPKLTQAGREVMDKGRSILQNCESLKDSSDTKTAGAGPFRLGLSYALAQPDISGIVAELGIEYPLLEPNICTDVSPCLLERLHTGGLDMAVVILPDDAAVSHNLAEVMLLTESFYLVQARNRVRPRSSKPSELHERRWVLNPPGCLMRDKVSDWIAKSGGSLKIAAEVHNLDLQLALIAEGVGIGLVPANLLLRHHLRAHLSVIKHPVFQGRIACVRGRHLGKREHVAFSLERIFFRHLQATVKTHSALQRPLCSAK